MRFFITFYNINIKINISDKNSKLVSNFTIKIKSIEKNLIN